MVVECGQGVREMVGGVGAGSAVCAVSAAAVCVTAAVFVVVVTAAVVWCVGGCLTGCCFPCLAAGPMMQNRKVAF